MWAPLRPPPVKYISRSVGMDNEEQLVWHQSEQSRHSFTCHPSTVISNEPTTLQNPAFSFSDPNTSYNLVSFDNSYVEGVPSIRQPCTEQESAAAHDCVYQFGSSTAHDVSSRRNRGTRNGRNSKFARTTLDRAMAERKRRHELAENFNALSATIPGLKKMDKASVLEGTINYVKKLQQRIKEIEEKANKKKSIESAIFTKTSSVEKPFTFGHNNNNNNVLPEVEVRVAEREALIRIHCKKQNGIVLKIMSLLENTHLSVTSSSIFPFGKLTVSFTIIAQMLDEYSMTANDLVKKLRRDLCKLHQGTC